MSKSRMRVNYSDPETGKSRFKYMLTADAEKRPDYITVSIVGMNDPDATGAVKDDTLLVKAANLNAALKDALAKIDAHHEKLNSEPSEITADKS